MCYDVSHVINTTYQDEIITCHMFVITYAGSNGTYIQAVYQYKAP